MTRDRFELGHHTVAEAELVEFASARDLRSVHGGHEHPIADGMSTNFQPSVGLSTIVRDLGEPSREGVASEPLEYRLGQETLTDRRLAARDRIPQREAVDGFDIAARSVSTSRSGTRVSGWLGVEQRQGVVTGADVGTRMKVLFIDGEESRMVRAALQVAEQGICRPVLLGRRSVIRETADDVCTDLSAMEIIDPIEDAIVEELLAGSILPSSRYQGSDGKPMPAYCGGLLVRSGRVDAAVGGSSSTSADMLRAGLDCIGLAPRRNTASGVVFLEVGRKPRASTEVMAFADAVVTPSPTVNQMVDIAAATIATWRSLMPTTPRVAFVSFSTLGSSRASQARRVRAAADAFRSRFPTEIADGELQFDAAVSPDVARLKAPHSPVAGRANIFIFPSLESANIAYKVAEQLAGARAWGVLQGLARPFADVSRGCSVDDIVTTVTTVVAQAQQNPAPSALLKGM